MTAIAPSFRVRPSLLRAGGSFTGVMVIWKTPLTVLPPESAASNSNTSIRVSESS